MAKNTYKVEGMTCGGCARSVESAIKAKAPAAEIVVDLDGAKVTVEGVAEDVVRQAVDDAGFTFAGAA
jgi:copper chaperone